MYCLSSEMSILGEVNSRITPDLWKRNLISWNSMDFSSYIVYSWLLLTCAFTHKLSLDMLNNLESILCYGLYAVDHPVTFCMSWWAWKKKKKKEQFYSIPNQTFAPFVKPFLYSYKTNVSWLFMVQPTFPVFSLLG